MKAVARLQSLIHGTQALIANFDVVTGQVIHATCGDSRNEQDFAQNIRKLFYATFRSAESGL